MFERSEWQKKQDAQRAREEFERSGYRRRSMGFMSREKFESSGEYSGDCRSLGFLKGVAA